MRSRLTLAQLWESLGERERAAAAYAQLLGWWRDAEPALEPQRRLAREGLARVRDAAPGRRIPVGPPSEAPAPRAPGADAPGPGSSRR